MADLKPRHIGAIASGKFTGQQLAECILDIVNSHNSVARQTNATPVGETPAPLSPGKLTVSAGAGFFRAHIDDQSPAYRGKEWFLEASENEAFTTPHKMHLGATTDHYVNLGPKLLHFRAYSGQSTSGASSAVYAMNVDGTGGTAPAVTGNTAGGNGYGEQPYNTDLPPKRA